MEFEHQSFNNEYFKECEAAGLRNISEGEKRLFHIGSLWYRQRRPFFNVYPGVEKCLRNTRLDIDPEAIPQSIIHQLGVMEVRTQAGSKTPSFFLAVLPGVTAGKSPVMAVHTMRTDTRGIQSCVSPFGKQLDDRSGPKITDDWDGSSDADEMLTEVTARLRIAIGVMLLASDPRYCEPVLLNRDKGKLLNETEREVAIERARRNGNYGFDIGKGIEVSPHFRRPHFAIRWTGKGSSVPRLVPVKGAVINESLVTTVPTGYEDEQ